MGINYDDINLPQKVSDILQQDFFLMENVPARMVRTVKNPVKFSAFTSIFLTKGSCMADINLRKYKITAPAIVNISPDQIVLPSEVSDDFQASFMVFSNRYIESLTTIIKDLSIFSLSGTYPIISLSPEDFKILEDFYADMRRTMRDNNNKYIFETLVFSSAALFYKTAIKYFDRLKISSRESTQARIADKFLRLVQQNFRKERFLEFYADSMDISPRHLSRTVRSQTGLSAVEWINRHIILEAKVMLRSSNLNIQQIASELNFPSQSFFGKYFKKATGVTPKEYRTSHLGATMESHSH